MAVLVLSGCSLVAPYENSSVRNAEHVWLGLQAMDTAQTVTIARSPTCLRESNPVAATIYGSAHPSAQRVLLTNVALGYVHYRVGGWIDQRTEAALSDPDNDNAAGWYLFRAAWHGLAWIGTGYAVLHNASGRVGPFTRVTECEHE